MKMISTKTHAVLDYTVGILLIAAPWLLGFADNRAAMLVPTIAGIATLAYSLLTDYEYSLLPVLSYRLHLIIDFASGVLLMLSPLVFGFSERIWWPHLAVGLLEILVVSLSGRHSKKIRHASR